MVITTLIENLVYGKGMVSENGLSFFLDTGRCKILIDTGQTGNFVLNAQNLGIDLSETDFLVLTHGHYDHTGGIEDFLDKNDRAKIVSKPDTFSPKFKSKNYIGFPQSINIPKERVIHLENFMELTDCVFVGTTIKSFYDIDNHKDGFKVMQEKDYIPDNFDDELFICIKRNEKISIISSCSHNGITNIIETAKQHFKLPVSTVVGGFHTKNASRFHTKNASPDAVGHIIKYFNENDVENIGICHCTGIENYPLIKTGCTGNVFYNYTGSRIQIT
jgi:7,8-dihydropterin-6-yl-methyl-4-(beta-D-ribofuranosyl)aminobenzene 5'-phosphate synthase